LTDAVAAGADRLSIPHGASIVLAVSGGPDSMALLHGVARLAPGRRWQLIVAHLDHALRTESAQDADFVGAAAAALGLRYESRRVEVAAVAAERRSGIEEAGRAARYAFLSDVAASDALIATAHTADDSAETILLNLVRGSGLAGARGIPARRGNVIRPLLHARRESLRTALDDAGLAYLTDPSNADVAFARNRIRNDVLPMLERINPAAVRALVRFGRLAADDDDLLGDLARHELDRRRLGDGGIDWHEPPARPLARRLVRLAVGQPTPSAERIEALLDAAEGWRGGITVELGGGREASVRERVIHLR
jgi:tRNA(Ile)-lysidine synthase